MNQGCGDMFFYIVYWVDDSFKRRTRHLRMIKIDSTSGSQMAWHVTNFHDDFNIKDKILAYVTDGGPNLTICSRELKGIICCAVLDI